MLCPKSKTIICYDCNVHVVMPSNRFNLDNKHLMIEFWLNTYLKLRLFTCFLRVFELFRESLVSSRSLIKHVRIMCFDSKSHDQMAVPV